MSRKRKTQRDNLQEVARQMGVAESDVPQQILAHGRVSEPSWKAALVLHEARRGFFRKPGPMALHIALFIVDSAGARLARLESWRGQPPRPPCPVVLTLASTAGPDKVRYTRPGRFMVAVLLTEGASDEAVARHGAAMASAAIEAHVVKDGKDEQHLIGDRALGNVYFEAPHAAHFHIEGRPIVEDDVPYSAGALLSLPAVHRVQDIAELPLAAPRLRAELRLELRL